MYIYSVGYGTYDDWHDIELYHEKEFSQDDFERLIANILIEILPSQLEAYEAGKRKFDLHKGTYYRPYFYEFYRQVADILCEKHGFSRVKYTASVSMSSHESMFLPPIEEVLGSEHEDADDRIRLYLNQAGFTPDKYPEEEDLPELTPEDYTEEQREWREGLKERRKGRKRKPLRSE